MLKTHHISWTTPASMLASLLAGVVFALAHHILYSRLAGTTASASNFNVAGYQVSQQQINTASGTALAFLTKVCLVLAISIAYTQAFWRAIGRSRTQVSTLDTISSVLNNVWAFLRVQVWWKYPLLLLLALSAWYAARIDARGEALIALGSSLSLRSLLLQLCLSSLHPRSRHPNQWCMYLKQTFKA